jgi:uncharacterized damage-inducible protein DinB
MQNKMIWANRKFKFDMPAEMYPMVVERLRGTPARVEDKTKGLSDDILSKRVGDAWSIKEQIGHLLMVDMLWFYRLEDFLDGKEILTAADMENKRTKERKFNDIPLSEILSEFRASREKLVALLDSVEESQVEATAHHPRLNQPMRLIDSYFFAAEHDDHHLAKITDLIRISE